MALHPDVRAFADLLIAIEALLRKRGDRAWAEEVARCLRDVERSDANGLHRFLGLFGGMGSLNDLGGGPDALEELLSRAYGLGKALARDEP